MYKRLREIELQERMGFAWFASEDSGTASETGHDLVGILWLGVCRCFFRGASPGQDVDNAVVPLAARVLKHWPITVAQWNNRGPRLRPRGRVIDRELVLDRARVEPRETLGDLQGLRIRVLEGSARTEIGGFHDERVAFPMTPGIPVPSMEVLGEMRAPIERDNANFAVPFVFDHHVTCGLNNVYIAVVSSWEDRRPAKRKAAHAKR